MKLIDKSKEPLLKDASIRFKAFKKDFKYNDLSKYDDKMLTDAYRDLNYIDGLKSSTLQGAIEAKETFGTTRTFLDSLSEKKREEFWDLYDKLYKNLKPEDVHKYRYEVFDYMTSMRLSGVSEDEIFRDIKEAYDKAYEVGQKYHLKEEEIGELFAENINILYTDQYDDLWEYDF